MRTKLLLIATALIAGVALTYAQTSHTGHVDDAHHSAHGPLDEASTSDLTEPGQGAFAALSEVVRVLEGDPSTNWSKVDLTGLRAHLVDMDRLISDTVVEETLLPNGISAIATGDPETIATLRRMVPAHATQLALDDRWTVTTSEIEEGVALRVTGKNPTDVARIKGLGFFGLMASQDHHRRHHLMMALGKDAHDH